MDHSERFIIEDGVLKGYSGNVELVIPEGVCEIGDQAFMYDRSIAAVTLPEGLERIGDLAFMGCSNLKSINIPESVKEIGSAAFENCNALSTITQPAQDAVLATDAFRGCNGLADEDGFLIVKNILYGYTGHDACVCVPQGVKEIGFEAFAPAEVSLTAVTLPEGLEVIGRGAFIHCKKLVSVCVPQKVKRICDGAFYRCTSLTDIKLPGNAEIENAAFVGCKQLADENGFIIINGILFDYYGDLSEVVVPDGVTRISDLAFDGNGRLRRITLPETLKSIGCAFEHCQNLERVDLPKGEVLISKHAFRDCDLLQGQNRYEPDD